MSLVSYRSMFLIIDNTEEEKIIFHYSLDNKLVQRIYKTSKTGRLLVCLDKLLSHLKLKLKDIKQLGVVVGAGRFTSTRLAVTAANTLAYSLKIPVVALPKNFTKDSVFKMAKIGTLGQYVIPAYSGEPRIGS